MFESPDNVSLHDFYTDGVTGSDLGVGQAVFPVEKQYFSRVGGQFAQGRNQATKGLVSLEDPIGRGAPAQQGKVLYRIVQSLPTRPCFARPGNDHIRGD